MRLLAAVFALAALAPAAPAAEPDIRTAIADGLKFLAADSVEWKTERKCASCHHAPMALWALHEAKKHGYTVDDKAVSSMAVGLFALPCGRILEIGVGSPPNHNPYPAMCSISLTSASSSRKSKASRAASM